jgi:hypothetical protein
LSSLTAACLIAEKQGETPGRPIDEVVATLKNSVLGTSGLDYASGSDIARNIAPENLSIATHTSFRNAISAWIAVYRPLWMSAFPSGRQKVRSLLSENELQCFELGELFSDTPSKEVVGWWDLHASMARNDADKKRLEQGRYAESLSMRYEKARIGNRVTTLPIKWMALEDNSAGFDILSFAEAAGKGDFERKFIEVKSTFGAVSDWYLTRNEWNTALSHVDSYEFHLWKLPEEELTIFGVQEVLPHIPIESGYGLWELIKIRVH